MMSSPAGAGAGASLQLPVYLLTGPTGTGKSDWAIHLAQAAPVEIVSVDSALVYRGLDIGTAKPARELRAQLPHHLIDICDPAESYSAGRFVTDAMAVIAAVHCAAEYRCWSAAPCSICVRCSKVWRRCHRRPRSFAARSTSAPHARAGRLFTVSSSGWIPRRPRASIATTAREFNGLWRFASRPAGGSRSCSARRVSPLAGVSLKAWALAPRSRPALHQRLASRFHAMMAAGFLDEVRALHGRGDLTASHSSMRAVGYRQLWGHLEGEYGLAEAVEQGIAATRQLAKRQLTWMRAETTPCWLDPDTDELSWNRDVA